MKRVMTRFCKKGQQKRDERENQPPAQQCTSIRDEHVTTHQNAPPSCQRHRLPSQLVEIEHGHLERLIHEAQDYQLVHGGMLKNINSLQSHHIASAQTVGISLLPSPFPKKLFEEACELQTIFQELYIAVSKHPLWLRETLEDLIATDPLTKTLWSVFETVQEQRPAGVATLCAAIFRSDYMIHAGADEKLQLKQVEFNTISCAGAVHGQRVADMHRHFQDVGLYNDPLKHRGESPNARAKLYIPPNENVRGIVSMLEIAHDVYQQSYRFNSLGQHTDACILMIVQPYNFNIADERPIEYALRAMNPSIACFRLQWGEDVLNHTTLTSSRVLLYHPPHLAQSYEVSVVYFRAGFEAREFEGSLETLGFHVRTRLEVSNAAKCPDILTHLTTFKKVQQQLCVPGSVERFIARDKADRLRRSFMQMYPLDDTQLGLQGRQLATDSKLAKFYVLKPNKEGGGHNIYREKIPPFLTQAAESRWKEYVLMEMIEPVVSINSLVGQRGVWQGDVVAELGVWGGGVWQTVDSDSATLSNEQFGWSVRSKSPHVDELSVVKGFGCFDSVALLNLEEKEPVIASDAAWAMIQK